MRRLTERDFRYAIHPDENARFYLALVFVCLAALIPTIIFIFSVIWPYFVYDFDDALSVTIGRLLRFLLFLGLVALYIWLGYLFIRGRLRANAAFITATSLPEMDGAIRRVCEALGYPREALEAFLVQENSFEARVTEGLRRDLMVIHSDVAEAMYEYNAPAELEFVVASHVGTLQARILRTEFIARVQVAAGTLPVIGLLVRPYLRATVYSADRLALMTTGNLQSAIDAIGVKMVGKDLTSLVALPGWIQQHGMMQGSFISFLLRMRRNEPHPIDRLANIVCFGRVIMPDQYQTLVGQMPAQRRNELESVLDRSRHARTQA